MGNNAYLERMQENEQTRVKTNTQALSATTGLPIARPGQGQTDSPSGVPVGQAPIPKEDESYKDSTFYMNFDHHRQNDPHFDGMVGELTKLATGLRHQVNSGFMPPVIAEKRIHQFVMDTAQQFEKRQPQMDKEKAEADKQQRMQQMLGMLMQQQGGGQAPQDPNAPQQPQAPQEQAPEEAQAPQEGTNGL